MWHDQQKRLVLENWKTRCQEDPPRTWSSPWYLCLKETRSAQHIMKCNFTPTVLPACTMQWRSKLYFHTFSQETEYIWVYLSKKSQGLNLIVDWPHSIQFCCPISLGLSGRCSWNRYRLLGGHPPNSSWQSFVLLLNGQRSRGPPSSPFLATSQQNKRDPCSGFLCWIDRQNNRPTQNKSQFSHVDDTVKIKWNHLVEEMLKG